jgi:hypothetical protein
MVSMFTLCSVIFNALLAEMLIEQEELGLESD